MGEPGDASDPVDKVEVTASVADEDTVVVFTTSRRAGPGTHTRRAGGPPHDQDIDESGAAAVAEGTGPLLSYRTVLGGAAKAAVLGLSRVTTILEEHRKTETERRSSGRVSISSQASDKRS